VEAISLGPSEPADRLLCLCLRFVELSSSDHVGDHRVFEAAWADGVDADPAGCVLERAAGEADDTVFEVVQAARPGSATRPPSYEQFTIASLPRSLMYRSSCLMHAHTPRSFDAKKPGGHT
jgi:hypothetical protein